jgi:hypothetical protein
MRIDLSGSPITAGCLSKLINSAYLFAIPVELADIAADALIRSDYQVDCGQEKENLPFVLLGLASVAATSRSHKLADALFILLRKYQHLFPAALSLEEAFRIAMIASASRADLSEWRLCVGNFLASRSFDSISEMDAAVLHTQLHQLCHLVPELWASCGQAEAALRAVLNV